MSNQAMKSIQVLVLGRKYALRVQEGNEEDMRAIVDAVDERMRKFQRAHPDQAELTTAVITALALAEELDAAREEKEEEQQEVAAHLNTLAGTLADALPEETA
jgi:cell division protein ZapA